MMRRTFRTPLLPAMLVLFAIAAVPTLKGAPVETALAAKPPTHTPAPTATPAPPTATHTPTATAGPPTATRTPTATATGPTATPTVTGSCTVNVSTATALTTALQNATPGTVICLAAGTYAGRFTATVSGTSTAHIVLTGPSTAILDGGDTTTGYGFYLNAASYWELRGFTIRTSNKGVMTDNATFNLLDNLTVYNIGQEGVHFRNNSANNTIQNSTVHDTGRVTADFGEGIYIGTANCTTCDRSDYNQVLSNHLGPNITAEEIDVKEGTTGGLIDGNYLDATGMCGCNSADSWIQANGNNYTYSNNTGVNPNNVQPPNFLDGIQIHDKTGSNGQNNIFKLNTFDVRTTGYGFWFDSIVAGKGNVVCTNNTVTNAGSGVANIPLTAC